jgi:azurin
VRAGEGRAPLLHDVGYYTVNQIPRGQTLAVKPAAASAPTPGTNGPIYSGSGAASGRAPGRALAKHQTTMPADWNGAVDQTVTVQGVDGLKFDLPAIDVKAGARVKLDFSNVSDMLHNLVVVRPGTATKVGEAALRLGLDGAKLDYVPRTDDVLYYTSVLEPQKSETIYFVAPTTPGEYTYVCTFPGHYVTMQGTMRVGR